MASALPWGESSLGREGWFGAAPTPKWSWSMHQAASPTHLSRSVSPGPVDSPTSSAASPTNIETPPKTRLGKLIASFTVSPSQLPTRTPKNATAGGFSPPRPQSALSTRRETSFREISFREPPAVEHRRVEAWCDFDIPTTPLAAIQSTPGRIRPVGIRVSANSPSTRLRFEESSPDRYIRTAARHQEQHVQQQRQQQRFALDTLESEEGAERIRIFQEERSVAEGYFHLRDLHDRCSVVCAGYYRQKAELTTLSAFLTSESISRASVAMEEGGDRCAIARNAERQRWNELYDVVLNQQMRPTLTMRHSFPSPVHKFEQTAVSGNVRETSSKKQYLDTTSHTPTAHQQSHRPAMSNYRQRFFDSRTEVTRLLEGSQRELLVTAEEEAWTTQTINFTAGAIGIAVAREQLSRQLLRRNEIYDRKAIEQFRLDCEREANRNALLAHEAQVRLVTLEVFHRGRVATRRFDGLRECMLKMETARISDNEFLDRRDLTISEAAASRNFTNIASQLRCLAVERQARSILSGGLLRVVEILQHEAALEKSHIGERQLYIDRETVMRVQLQCVELREYEWTRARSRHAHRVVLEQEEVNERRSREEEQLLQDAIHTGRYTLLGNEVDEERARSSVEESQRMGLAEIESMESVDQQLVRYQLLRAEIHHRETQERAALEGEEAQARVHSFPRLFHETARFVGCEYNEREGLHSSRYAELSQLQTAAAVEAQKCILAREDVDRVTLLRDFGLESTVLLSVALVFAEQIQRCEFSRVASTDLETNAQRFVASETVVKALDGGAAQSEVTAM